ncbi:MAG: hypothetical protein ACI85J_001703, partial [Candidatus Poriferisodalaceae bacterium]
GHTPETSTRLASWPARILWVKSDRSFVSQLSKRIVGRACSKTCRIPKIYIDVVRCPRLALGGRLVCVDGHDEV